MAIGSPPAGLPLAPASRPGSRRCAPGGGRWCGAWIPPDLCWRPGAWATALMDWTGSRTSCWRLPRGLSVVRPRSACPRCKQSIAFYDNLPVLSWLILGGRCRHCKEKISPRYWMIEGLTGLLFLACYWYFGLTLSTLK